MHLSKRILIACIDLIRPQFGFRYACCIYEISCSDYAKNLITTKPWYYYLPHIAWRLLCCNPIAALLRLLKRRL